MWKEKYELGVPAIDNQHKQLFIRVESFVEALRSHKPWEEKVVRVNETLEFMKGYVVEHFRDEEAYQKSIGYPKYEAHKKRHESMVAYVQEVSEEYAASGCSELLMQQFAGKLLAWLINHVATEDFDIAVYAKSRNFYMPLREAAGNVFKTMLDLNEITEIEEEQFTHSDVLKVSVGVTGDYTGKLIYHFPTQMSLNLVKIMSGLKINIVDEFVASAVFEITNIISGNIATILSEGNIQCGILPPEPYHKAEGQSHEIKKDCYIRTEAGDVFLCVRLNQTA